MALPNTLLDLGLTLRAEHDGERQRHIAQLAARLGFRYVWLPVSADVVAADTVAATAALVDQARPARVGLVVTDGQPDVVQRVAALRAGDLDVLLEIHAPVQRREELVAAVGGPSQWRERVVVPWYDADAAGLVVLAEEAANLAAVQASLAGAAARRLKDGRVRRRFPISVALTVSIGRTMSEAQARAMRDPALSGVHDPRAAGLFGTLEQAQEQALMLARAGADAVRATLADERDVADLLAQLRAVAVGPTPVLHGRHA